MVAAWSTVAIRGRCPCFSYNLAIRRTRPLCSSCKPLTGALEGKIKLCCTARSGRSFSRSWSWNRSRNSRTADAQTDWEALFLSRAQRRVRLDATFSLEGQLWEAPLHLRGQLIQVRFNPFDWRRVEIWCEDKYVGPARRCDKQLNSKTYTDRDYDRPDKSASEEHTSELQ